MAPDPAPPRVRANSNSKNAPPLTNGVIYKNMITRAKTKRTDLFDLPGTPDFCGFFTPNTTATLTTPRLPEIKERETSPQQAKLQRSSDFPPVILDEDTTPAKTNKTGNRRVLRLSQESREILKLLKKNLRLTYDQQIQFLGQLVLHHELLSENSSLEVQQRIRELRRFSRENGNNQPNHLHLSRPLPLESLLAALEERCTQLQNQLETLTNAIDASTQLRLVALELQNDDSHEAEFPALN
jgi:hypothetical protein